MVTVFTNFAQFAAIILQLSFVIRTLPANHLKGEKVRRVNKHTERTTGFKPQTFIMIISEKELYIRSKFL